jgi:deoxyribodipyrimidine photo-lyase
MARPPAAGRKTAIGQAGIDAFDAWTRERVETGYLHNHACMWFASIWTFTLRLHLARQFLGYVAGTA